MVSFYRAGGIGPRHAAGVDGCVYCHIPENIERGGNDLAETLLAAGWIDVLADHAEMDAALVKWVGAEDEEGLAPMVSLEQYQEDMAMRRSETEQGLPLIAIVPVEGTLVPGESEEGMAGSDTITHYIETGA